MNAGETVFVIDDDASVRKALSNLLRSAGYSTRAFAGGQAFLEHSVDEPGCIILDLSMPGTGGLEFQEMLTAQGRLHPIVFLSGRGDVSTTAKAMKGGALDFLEKPVDADALLMAVEQALNKDRERRSHSERLADAQARLEALTAREFEVLRHVIAGRLNKLIAFDLGISEKTVKVHRARAMEKMRVRSVAELVRLTDALGLPPIEPSTTKVQ